MPFAMRNWRRMSLAATILCCAAGGSLSPARGAEPDGHYTAPTPDALVERAARVAQQGGPDGLARVLLITSLASEAGAGKARHALEAVGKGKGPVAEQAHWLARELEPEAHDA